MFPIPNIASYRFEACSLVRGKQVSNKEIQETLKEGVSPRKCSHSGMLRPGSSYLLEFPEHWPLSSRMETGGCTSGKSDQPERKKRPRILTSEASK